MSPTSKEIISTDEIIESKELGETNLKNIMAVSLELTAITNIETNPDLTYLVDGFESDALIDPSSSNFNINSSLGYVELIQGGSLQAKDETETDFNQGTFAGTQSIDDGEDGAILKQINSPGGITQLESFDDLTNVNTTGDATQSLNTVLNDEGTGCLEVDLNFGDDATATATTVINFPTNINLSNDTTLRFSYRPINLPSDNNNNVAIDFTVGIRDGSNNIYNYDSFKVMDLGGFQQVSLDLTQVSGVDLTDVSSIEFIFDENDNDQIILDAMGSGDASQNVEEGSDIAQSFSVSEDVVCKRLRFRAFPESAVTENLNVGISNSFGTTYAVGILERGTLPSTDQDYTVELDLPVQLKSNLEYRALFRSATSGNQEWKLRRWSSDVEPSGFLYVNNNGYPTRDAVFALLTEPLNGSILIDNLEVEGQSLFQQNGDFVSRGFDLGQVPQSIDNFEWDEVNGGDTILVQVRFATTESLLSSASWSSNLNNPQTDFSAIPINQWFQYRVQFVSGTTTSTSLIKAVRLDYTVAGGTGSAEVISVAEFTTEAPTKFILNWEDDSGSGAINYYVSRDGKQTWQAVLESQKNELIEFSSGSGQQIHAKAIITGDAKLGGWSLACNKEFVL